MEVVCVCVGGDRTRTTRFKKMGGKVDEVEQRWENKET